MRGVEADALAISANIQARHTPFGTVLDPILASSTSDQIVAYTRCGDSALWTGAYLAAESFRYQVTRSADALQNVSKALAGLKSLVDVTGDNRLALHRAGRFAIRRGHSERGIANTIHQNPHGSGWTIPRAIRWWALLRAWGGFDLVDDPGVKATVSDVATRMIGFISKHQWSPTTTSATRFCCARRNYRCCCRWRVMSARRTPSAAHFWFRRWARALRWMCRAMAPISSSIWTI